MSNNSQLRDDYGQFLASLHDKLTVPDELIQKVVKEATGENFQNKQAIVAGEENKVFDLELSNNQHVIVRLGQSTSPRFLQEEWAIKKCRSIGIPVPETLLIKHLSFNNEILSICIQRKIGGDVLERGSIDFEELSTETQRKILVQAGELLSKIHSIVTLGFGEINENGGGQFSNFYDFITENASKEQEYLTLARKVNLELGVMKQVIKILTDSSLKEINIKPVLNHGDFGQKHIMVKGGQITGIIDFGGAASNSPVFDFAWMDYWFSSDFPFHWIKEGYLSKDIFNNEFDNLIHLFRLNQGLSTLWWYYYLNYLPEVENAKKKLIKDLQFFE